VPFVCGIESTSFSKSYGCLLPGKIQGFYQNLYTNKMLITKIGSSRKVFKKEKKAGKNWVELTKDFAEGLLSSSQYVTPPVSDSGSRETQPS
jgi:hypothetical protein